jgi:excisionase family DNA binding protein
MTTSDFILALRNDISGNLKREIMDELRQFIAQQLHNNVFDFKETLEFLKISESTLRRMVARKEVPFFKQGGQYFFRQTSLIAWMEQMEKQNYLEAQ